MTTEDDQIVEAIRRHREAHAASLDFDLKRIVEDLQQQEHESGATVVIRPPREPLVVPKSSSA